MVPKASQRANARQLAAHLLNAHDNERVEVAHIRGAIARDLPGALDEWHAISKTTRCRKYLYSLSINPDPRQGPLTRSQYRDYIAQVEKKLKLTDQPRAIVFHAKQGREHCHVVWSRIIPSALKAVPISHDRKALQAITRRFAKQHGLTLPENMNPGGSPAASHPPVKVTLHEKHQQERTGASKDERVRTITRLWHETVTGQAFVRGIERAGYRLARGDRIPYAIVDPHGEIHSLPRQIEGVRTKDVRHRLSSFPPESLPAAVSLREEIRQRNATLLRTFNAKSVAPWAALKKSQNSRRAVFHARLASMKDQHRAERTALALRHKDGLTRFREMRLTNSATGLIRFVIGLPGIRHFLARRYRKEDAIYLRKCRRQRRGLISHQRAEFEDLKRQARAILRVERREARSLRTQLRREFLKSRVSESFYAAAIPPALPAVRGNMPVEFKVTACDITAHNQTPQPRSISSCRTHAPPKDSLSAVFAKAADPLPTRLRETFKRASGGST
ncbi:MAG: hypothetical protein OEY28_11800, partial [Nitrospira sp.]|nr:hypothetical protein [Nitrospira sp.]